MADGLFLKDGIDQAAILLPELMVNRISTQYLVLPDRGICGSGARTSGPHVHEFRSNGSKS